MEINIDKLVAEITKDVYSQIGGSAPAPAPAPVPGSGVNLAKMIDHTLLKADATEAQIIKLCEEAKEFGFASVCVNTNYVPLAASMLAGTFCSGKTIHKSIGWCPYPGTCANGE